MKNKFLFWIIFLCCEGMLSSLCVAQEKLHDQAITVKDYCDFLNAATTPLALPLKLKVEVEAINLNDLYDERMAGAFIMRTGLPGSYCYNLISTASTDSFNSCIAGLSRNDAIQYCEWRNHSASTFNLNSCAIDTASIDPELRSNKLTFHITSTAATATAAAGEEVVCSPILDDILETVFFIAGTGGFLTREAGRASSDFHEPEGRVSEQSPLIATEQKGSEETEIDQVIKNSSFYRPRQSEVLDQSHHDEWWREIDDQDQGHYGTVNQLWNQYSKKWTSWVLARRNLNRKQELLAHAQKESQQIEAALKAEDLTQTKFGRFITTCNDITSVAQYAPALKGFNPIALASQGASVIATRMQEGMVHMMKQGAKETIEKATQEVGTAENEVHAVLQGILGQDPQQTEEIARSEEAVNIMEAAKELQSHVQGATSDATKKAWQRKMHACDQEVFTQGIKSVERLAPLKLSYQQADKVRRQQQEAQEQIEIASQWRIQARKVLDGIIKECPIPQEAGGLENRQHFLAQRQSILEASRYHEKAQQIEEELLQRVQKMKTLYPKIEKKAIKLYEEYHNAKDALVRELDRVKARSEAYHAAWRSYWPKAAIHDELVRGEKAWKKAEQNKSEETWDRARNQAVIINELHTRLIHLSSQEQLQKEEWNKRGTIAAAKIAFFKLRKMDFSFLSEVLQPLDNDQALGFKTKAQQGVRQLENIANLLEPHSKEAAKAFRLTATALSHVENSATVPGWSSKIKESAEKIHVAAKKLNDSYWEEEAAWMKEVASQIGAAFSNTPPARSQSDLRTPGRLFTSESAFGDFFESSPVGIHMRYTKNAFPQETQERKELAELATLRKTSQTLHKKVKQLRIQVSQQAAERTKLESLQQKSLAKIAEIATKSEEQAQVFAAREADLTAQAAALKGASEAIKRQKEAELETLRKALAHERHIFEQEQEARLTSILTSLDEQTKALKIQEEELQLSEKTLEEVIQQYQSEIERLQQELREAKEQAEHADAARVTAERRATQEGTRAMQAEERVLQAEANADQAKTRIAEVEAQLRNLRQEKEVAEKAVQVWEHFLKKLNEAIEHERNAILQAEHAESVGSTEVEHAWQEAYKAAFTLEQLWEETIQGMDERIGEAKNLLEKHRLALEKPHAQKEREFWKQKTAEYLVKIEKLPKQPKRFDYDEKLTELRDKRAKMQEQQQEALARDDQKAAELYEQVAKILGSYSVYSYLENSPKSGATWAYEQAVEQQVKNNQKAEEAYRKCAQACEQQAEALAQGDQAGVGLQGKIAEAQGNAASAYNEAANVFNSATISQAKGHDKAVEAYRKSAQVYEQQAEALVRGDQAGAELQEKIAETQKYAARAYKEAAEAQAKGNDEAAEAYRKSAQILEQQAEALARGDQAGAKLQEKIAEAQWCAAMAYSEAATAQAKGNDEAAEIYRKCVQACEQEAAALARSAEALARGDQAGAELQEKIAEAQEYAARAYKKVAEAQAEGNDKAAEVYCKIAQAYEQQAEALARGDQAGAELQEKVANTQWHAASAYREAAEAKAKGNEQAAEACCKSAQACERAAEALARSAEALTRSDQAGAELQKKIAEAQGRAAFAYSEAATAQAKGNDKAAEAYRKQAQAFEQQAEALARGDQAGAELQKKIAEAQGRAASVYNDAGKAQAKGNEQAAEAYRKQAQAYEQQAEALARGDQAGAELQEEIAEAQWNAAWAYKNVAEAQAKGNAQEAEAHRKQAQAYEQQAEALARGDQAGAVLQEKIANVQENTASAYSVAATMQARGNTAQAEGNDQAAEAYRKSAQACEQQAEALARGDQAGAELQDKIAGAYRKSAQTFEQEAEALALGDQAEAELQKKIASAQGNAALAYHEAAEAKAKGNAQAAEAWSKCAQAREQEAEALARGDQAGAELQEKIAGAQEGAAWDYSEALAVQAKGNAQAAKAYRKRAQAFEQQAEALARGDQAGAELQRKIASAHGHAALAYTWTAEAQAEGNDKKAEAYRKCAQAYEQRVEAFARGDQAGAELQEEIANVQGIAARAYSKAATAGTEDNDKAAEGYRKSAQAHEQEAEALIQERKKSLKKEGNVPSFFSYFSKKEARK